MRILQLGVLGALTTILCFAGVACSESSEDSVKAPAAKKGAKLFGLVLQGFDNSIDGPALVQANPFTVRMVLAESIIESGSDPCQPFTGAGSSCTWHQSDQEIGAAAKAGAIPLPVLYGKSNKPPLEGNAAKKWKTFIASAGKRYGPGGVFWQGPFQQLFPGASPKPVKIWQIWNEPGSPTYFKNPNPAKYLRLLKAARSQIRKIDGKAKIMVGGLFSSTDKGSIKGRIPAVEFARKLYSLKGAKEAFDYMALHPYARDVNDMVNQIEQLRNVMKGAKDGGKTKLAITELGWSSNKPDGSLLAKGQKGQANTLQKAFKKLSASKAKYKLYTVDWFSLRDAPADQSSCKNCPYAGLNKVNGEPKKSWHSFLSFTK